MSFRSRERAAFFHGLGELLRSGTPPARALEVLGRNGPRPVRHLATRLTKALRGGAAFGDALAKETELLGVMETRVMAAAERGGRLDQACQLLADYHRALGAARAAVWRKAAYPLFLLHFGIFVLAAPVLVTDGWPTYVRQTVGVLAIIYAVGLALGTAAVTLGREVGKSATIERLVALLPVIGGVHRAFAVGRFAFTYELHLEAGVNVPTALAAAGAASGSALLAAAVARALPEVRAGARVGAALRAAGGRGPVPEELLRPFAIGEESGRMAEELRQTAADAMARGTAGIEVLAEWLPRLLYLAIVLYMAWRILLVWKGIWGGYQKVLDF